MKAEGSGTAEDRDGSSQKVSGSMDITSENWIARKVKGREEMMAFAKRLQDKMGFAPGKGGMFAMLGKMMENNEQIAAAMKKLEEESEKLDGLPVYVHTTFKTKMDGAPAGEEPEQPKMPKGLGGFMKKFKQPSNDDSVLMETTTKILKHETEPLNDSIFEIPATYKEEKKKS